MPDRPASDQLDLFGPSHKAEDAEVAAAPARRRPLSRLADEPEILGRLALAVAGGHSVSVPDEAKDRWPDIARTLRALGLRDRIERRHGARADVHLPLAVTRPEASAPAPDADAWLEAVDAARERLDERDEVSEAAGALLLVAERTLGARGSTFRDRALRLARTAAAMDNSATRIETAHMRRAIGCQVEADRHARLPARPTP